MTIIGDFKSTKILNRYMNIPTYRRHIAIYLILYILERMQYLLPIVIKTIFSFLFLKKLFIFLL